MSDAREWLSHPRQRWQQQRRHAHHLKEIDEYHRERDPTENAESTPPAEEEIRLHAIWLAESYPPSFFDSLLDAVTRLTRESRHTSGEPPAERIEEALRLGSSGWFPLGPVVPPGSPLYAYLPPIRAVLPADVEYAHASVHYLVPSHAVFVMCFVLDETGSTRVDERLRATYETYTTPHGNWTAIHTPANQKREAVRATRAEYIAELAKFFDREAPGLFASDGRSLPSIEFWTTKERKPFQEREERGRRSLHDFIELLGWVVWTNVWKGPDNLALKQAPITGDDFWSRAPNLQLVARERDLFAGKKLETSGGRTREAYVNRLNDSVSPLAATLALSETFRFYEAELVDSRRRLRVAQSRSLRRRVKATGAVQDRLLHQHADVDAISRGVGLWKDNLLRVLRHHTIDFERWAPPSLRQESDGEQQGAERRWGFRRWLDRLAGAEQPRREESKRRPWPRETWLETQTRGIVARADYVVSGSREISDVVRTISETTSTQASLRLQRWVAILTWVLAVIGGATLVVVIVTAQ